MKAWKLRDHKAAFSAAAMIMDLADQTGQTIEVTAENLERLEAGGLIRRKEDGSIILLTPEVTQEKGD